MLQSLKSCQTCLTVTGSNIQEFLENLQKIQKKDSDLIELRCDYIQDFKILDIQKIKETLQKPAIFTFRKTKDGGNFEGSLETWKQVLEIASMAGFKYLDIEFPSARYINLTKKHPETKIITSYHNFNHTNGYRDLRKIQKRMRGIKPDLMKFATFVKTEKDIKNLIRLLVSAKKDDKMIVIGMGDLGKITRIIAPILGSKINFLTGNESTAKGQLKLEDWNLALQNIKPWLT
jgi:3-dehydroquinate dehydratase-1